MKKGRSSGKNNRGRRVRGDKVPDAATQLSVRATQGTAALYKLVPGTALFAQAVHDPFSMLGKKPKMPMFPMLPTLTAINYINDFTVSTGAGQSGFVIINPAATICNDLNGVYYTDTGYAGTPATTFAPVGAGINNINVTGPYACGGFQGSAGLRARIIGVGIELTYSGPVLNAGGTFHALSHPDRSDLFSTESHNSIGEYLHARIEPVVDKEGGYTTIRLTRPMTEAADTKYLKFVSGVGFVYASDESTLSSDYNAYMGISIAGVDSRPFRARVFTVVEFYGKVVMPMATIGIADKPGGDTVVSHHNETTHAPIIHPPKRRAVHFKTETKAQKTSLLRSISDFAVKNQSHFIAAATALKALLA